MKIFMFLKWITFIELHHNKICFFQAPLYKKTMVITQAIEFPLLQKMGS